MNPPARATRDEGSPFAWLRALLFAALLPALLAALLASCADSRIVVGFDADSALMPRLRKILIDSPPPDAWELAADPAKASYRVSLEALDSTKAPPKNAALCGTIYYAASVDLSDPLYSSSAGRAEELGLAPLESILPPRRALAVDEAWPGSPRYPFARTLFLSASGRRGKSLPRDLGRWLAEAAARAESSEAQPLRLSAAGDIQIGVDQGADLLGGSAGIAKLLRGGLLERLGGADLAVANLESPISARGEPNPRKRYRFRMPRGASAALKEAGFDLLLFGNNHTLDFGPEAFADTLDDLAEAALPMVGAGRSLAEAASARVLEPKAGERVAFVGYSFFPDERMGFTRAEAAAGPDKGGVSADEEAALDSVRKAAESGATVVLLAHGGAEYLPRPSPETRRLYARFVDAGAALILGSHPHILQGCEARSGSLIAYSLGNFLFTLEEEPPEAIKGAMLDFLLYGGKVRGLMPQPIVAGFHHTEEEGDREAARARFSRLCAGIAALPPWQDAVR